MIVYQKAKSVLYQHLTAAIVANFLNEDNADFSRLHNECEAMRYR